MPHPPSDERREILQPSLLPVPDYCSPGKATPGYNYCVSCGVRDGASLAVIKIVTNMIITSLHLLCVIFKREAWLLTPINCYQSSCLLAVVVVTSHEVCAGGAATWSPGDMVPSLDIQGESLLPGARVW